MSDPLRDTALSIARCPGIVEQGKILALAGQIGEVGSANAASSYLWDKLQQGPDPYFPPSVPQLVALCNSTEDAAKAVQWVLNRGVKTYARGNGHSFAGVALVEAGLTLDLSQLKVQPVVLLSCTS